MEVIASRMMTAPTYQQARSIIVEHLEEVIYPYCLECSTFYMPSTGQSHVKQNHLQHHTQQRIGYKSKMWNYNDPFILPHDFTLIEENVCSALWEKLEGKDFDSRLQYWNEKGGNMNVISPSPLSSDDTSDERCDVLLEENQNDKSKVQSGAEAIVGTDMIHQHGTIGVNEVVDDAMNEQSDYANITTISIDNHPESVNHDLLQKLEGMERRLFEKLSQDQQNCTKAILNRLNDRESNGREMKELKSMLQNRNFSVLNRFNNEAEQTLQNADEAVEQNEIVDIMNTNSSNRAVVDLTMTGDGICTTQRDTTVCNNDDETNLSHLISPQKIHESDKIHLSREQQLKENVKRFRQMELQIAQLTFERDQLKLERDEALLLTEDMEKELYRLSQELDYFTDSGRTSTSQKMQKNDRTTTDDD